MRVRLLVRGRMGLVLGLDCRLGRRLFLDRCIGNRRVRLVTDTVCVGNVVRQRSRSAVGEHCVRVHGRGGLRSRSKRIRGVALSKNRSSGFNFAGGVAVTVAPTRGDTMLSLVLLQQVILSAFGAVAAVAVLGGVHGRQRGGRVGRREQRLRGLPALAGLVGA